MSKTNKKEYENKMRNDLKPMRNASFLGVNDGNTMRNAISQFISHSIDLQTIIISFMRT